MSYNPNIVRDSSRRVYYHGKPYFYKKEKLFNVMRDSLITRRLGGKNPFWVRGLDKTVPKFRWVWKNRKWIKYYAGAGTTLVNAKRNSKLQKGSKYRPSKHSSRHSNKRCYFFRGRLRCSGSNKSHGRSRSDRLNH